MARARVAVAAARLEDLRRNLEFIEQVQDRRAVSAQEASLTGDATERVDTRVLQVIYRGERDDLPLFCRSQLDVFIGGAPGEKTQG